MLRLRGGLIRYWVKLPSESWKVIFGIYIGGEKFNSPRGQLDVWIRPSVAAEFTGAPAEDIKAQLKQFTIHHETETSVTVRISDVETSTRLYVLLQLWNTGAGSSDGKSDDEDL